MHFLIKNGRKCEEKHFTPLDINAAKAADGSKNYEVINSYNSLL